MPSGSSLDLRKTAQKAGGDSLDSLLNQLRVEEDLTSRATENIEKYLKSLLQANETWKEFTARIKDSDRDWQVINEHVQKLVDDFDLLTNTSEEIVGIFGEIRKGLGGVNGELADAKKAVNGIYSISQKVVDSVNIEGLYTRRNLKTNMQKAAQAMQTYQREVNYIESIYGKGQAGQQALLDEMDSLQAKIRRQQNELGELRGSERAAAYARIASWNKQIQKAEWYYQILHDGHQNAAKSAERAAEIVYESYDEAIKGAESGFARLFSGIAKNFGVDTSGAQEYLDNIYQQRGKAISDYRMFKESLIGSENVKGTFEGKGISYDKDTGKFSSTKERQEASSSYAAILEAKSKKEQEESNLENLIQKALNLKASGLQTPGKPIDDRIAEYRSELQGLTADIEDLGKKADELDEKFALSTADQLIAELEAKEKEQNETLKKTNVTLSGFLKGLLHLPQDTENVNLLGAAWKGLGGWVGLVVGLVTKVWKAFITVNEHAVEFKRRTGQWAQGISSANLHFATTVDWMKQAVYLADELGANPLAFFTGDEIGEMAELGKQLGFSEKEAGNLGIAWKMAGKTGKDFQSSIEKSYKTQASLNRAAPAFGTVMKEIANASYSMQATMGFSAEKLAKAATSAKSLGMSLEDLNSVSHNLLDFESSISAQMEAQLMTGRALNLNRAREAALMGDLGKVGEELLKQNITASEFGKMNVLARESLAKAMGMNVEQLSKMVILQEQNRNLSNEELSKLTGISVQQIKAVKMTDQWETGLQKIFQAFAPIFDIIVLISDALTPVLTAVGGIIHYVVSLVSLLDNAFGITKSFAAVFGTVSSWMPNINEEALKTSKSVDNVVESAEKAGNAIYDASGKATTGAQASIGGFTGVLNTVKSWLLVSVGLGMVWKRHAVLDTLKTVNFALKDAIKNTTLWKTASEGIGKLTDKVTPKWFKNAAAKRTQLTGKVAEAGAAASKGAEGINSTTQAAARTGMNAGKILAGAAAMLAFAGAIWILVKAMQGMKDLDGSDLVGLGIISLMLVGVTYALAGIAPVALTASVAMLAFGGAVALIGWGLGQAAPGIEAFGNVLSVVFDGIIGIVDSVTTGLSNMFAVLGTLDAIQLALIGPALLSIAGGLTALSAVSLGSSILSLFGAGPSSELLRLAAAGDGMQAFATAVVTLATAVVTLNAALDHLNTEKLTGLSKIKGLNLQVGNLANVAVVNSGLPVASAPEKTIETVIQKEDKVAQEKTGESNRNSKEILNLQEGLKTINQKFDKLISLVQTPRATTVTLDQRVFDGQVIYGSSL